MDATLKERLCATVRTIEDVPAAIQRAYELGALSGPDTSTFLDATAQQVMAALSTVEDGELVGDAEYAYDAAHALLAERTRRQAK